MRTGKLRAVLGRAVILTTGGAGKVWPFTTNGSIKTGDGMALAYREGVALKDMEFVQYHPTGLPGTGILITEASRGEGGYLINSEGERFLTTRDYGVGTKAELGPRDMISRAIIQEIEAGRGIALPGKIGQYVHLDLRHLGKAKLESRLPFVLELARTYAGVDPVTQPIPIRPVLHYMMGGVDVGHRRRHRRCRPLRGGRDRLRVAERRQPARLELAHRVSRVRRARRRQHAVRFAKGASAGSEAGARSSRARREAARLDGIRGRKRGGETLAGIRQALNDGDGGRHRRLSRAGLDAEGGERRGRARSDATRR